MAIRVDDGENDSGHFSDGQGPCFPMVAPRVGALQRESGKDLRGGPKVEAAIPVVAGGLWPDPIRSAPL